MPKLPERGWSTLAQAIGKVGQHAEKKKGNPKGKKKSRAHEPFGSCALFQLRRKVFMLPGSICRENIPAPFSWQEVSLSFSVETCVGLCKSQCAEAFHRVPALRRRGLFFRSGKKNRGRMNLSVLAPSFNCAAKFLCFPAQSVARIFLLHFLGKRSRSLFLWKPV